MIVTGPGLTGDAAANSSSSVLSGILKHVGLFYFYYPSVLPDKEKSHRSPFASTNYALTILLTNLCLVVLFSCGEWGNAQVKQRKSRRSSFFFFFSSTLN